MQLFPPDSHGLSQPEAGRAKEAVDARLLDALEAFLNLIKEMEPVFINARRRPIAANGPEVLPLQDQLRARKVEVLVRHVGGLLRSWGRIPRVIMSNAGDLRNTTSGTAGVVPYASVKLADAIHSNEMLASRRRFGSVTKRRAIRLRRSRLVNTRGLPVLVTLGEGEGSLSYAPELKPGGFAGIMMGRLQKEDKSMDLTKRGQVLVLEPASDLDTLKRRVESRLPF